MAHTSTLITKQRNPNLVNIDTLIAAYNQQPASRILRDAMREFIRTFGHDKLQGVVDAYSGAVDALAAVPVFLSPATLNNPAPVEGDVLTVVPGIADAIPEAVLTYQWKIDGVDVTDETNASYTTLTADVGKVPSCVVTATNSEGTATQTAAAAAIVAAS